MKELTDSTFNAEVLKARAPVVVKFGATWCQPCKAIQKILDELESEFKGAVTFYSADVEQCQIVAGRYSVSQVPTLVAFDNGVVTAMRSGAAMKSQILSWIDSAFPGARGSTESI